MSNYRLGMVTPTAATIALAPEHETPRLLETLTLAFAADPAVRWMYPDPGQYLRYFPALAEALGGSAVVRGTAFRSEGGHAVALWLPPGAAPDEEKLIAVIEASVERRRRDEVFTLFQEMERHHPGGPHWYLPLIGVDPLVQGRGLGAALVRCGLRQCDEQGLPAYLESTNPRNITLYERHGFETVAEITVGGNVRVCSMRRQAHGRQPRDPVFSAVEQGERN